jgi:threonine aldolase
MAPEVARLVTSWQTSAEEVVEAAAIFRDAVTRAG